MADDENEDLGSFKICFSARSDREGGMWERRRLGIRGEEEEERMGRLLLETPWMVLTIRILPDMLSRLLSFQYTKCVYLANKWLIRKSAV